MSFQFLYETKSLPRGLRESAPFSHYTDMEHIERPNALAFMTDDTLTDEQWAVALGDFVRPAIAAEIDRLLPPGEVERRLAALKARVERAERDSNPHASE